MTWAEFTLRSFGFKEKVEREMLLTREVSYEVYKLGFLFGKKKPFTKNKFWKIGGGKDVEVSQAAIDRFKAAKEEYKKKKNG